MVEKKPGKPWEFQIALLIDTLDICIKELEQFTVPILPISEHNY